MIFSCVFSSDKLQKEFQKHGRKKLSIFVKFYEIQSVRYPIRKGEPFWLRCLSFYVVWFFMKKLHHPSSLNNIVSVQNNSKAGPKEKCKAIKISSISTTLSCKCHRYVIDTSQWQPVLLKFKKQEYVVDAKILNSKLYIKGLLGYRSW